MDALEKYRRDETRRLICWIRENRSGRLDILNVLLSSVDTYWDEKL